jgi:hypothetical protein
MAAVAQRRLPEVDWLNENRESDHEGLDPIVSVLELVRECYREGVWLREVTAAVEVGGCSCECCEYSEAR